MIERKKMKIFVSAYACEPDLGSEIGVGWNWVLQMSKFFDVWVLTRESNKETIERWRLKNTDVENIKFIYFDLPHYLRFWKKGMRGVRIYYNMWQWCSNSVVKKTMKNYNIEIFHHLTYGNSLWSVSRYGKSQFFIWGPVGGTEAIGKEFTKHYSLKGRLIEAIRRLMSASLPLNVGYQNRCKHANLILAKTEAQHLNLPERYRGKSILFTDVGVEINEIDKSQFVSEQEDVIKYLVVGKLDPWRGFDVLIEAFSEAAKINARICLQIVGKGADGRRLKRLIASKRMEQNIHMLGKVSVNTYKDLMRKADVVVNPSLKEGAVTTVFDALAMGKPLLCADTQGYTRCFNNAYAVIIPIDGRQNLIREFRDGILNLTDSNVRDQMSYEALKACEGFTWENKGCEIYELISKEYSRYKRNYVEKSN